jgi:ribonuclease R
MSNPPRKLARVAKLPKRTVAKHKPTRTTGTPVDAASSAGLPSEAEVRAFIAAADGRVGKREIAKAFGIKGSARLALKAMLAAMGETGEVVGNRTGYRGRARMPALPTLLVTARTADGDLVGEPLDWDEDEGPRPRVLLTGAADARGEATRGDGAVGMGERVVAKVKALAAPDADGCTHEGAIVRRLPREERRMVGIFQAADAGGGHIAPIDRKELRSWHVGRGDEGEATDGDLVRFDLVRQRRHTDPRAVVAEVLGNPTDQRQVSLIAVHAHGIPDEFPAGVLAESEAVAAPDPATRTDLTRLPFVTIDPVDARDHDDAVHAAPDPDPANRGGFVVHVAIADVSHFIRPFSALDREAALRGNSVYFPDRVVPMLPERISNDLCSLREGEVRSVLVARLVFDAGGEKRGQRIDRAIIRSRAKLAYEQAQAAIEGRVDAKAATVMADTLEPLWAAYRTLAAARDRRAPLDLDLPERRIKLDGEGRVAGVVIPQRLDAHRLIEECMIQANVAAAEVLETKKAAVVYRVHDQPSKEKLAGLRDFLATLDLRVPPAGSLKPAALNRVLAEAKALPVPDLVAEVVLRSQAQAEYHTVNIGHFGLNLARYAHFTSPIRRYADLLVHRALVRALKLGDGGMDEREVARLAGVCETISRAERRAMAAERETIDRLVAAHLADRVGASFPARISGVTRSGLFVKLDGTGADGFVPVSTLGAEFFQHVEGAHALVGARSGRGYRLGDRVSVKLLEVVPSAGAMRFEMESAPTTLGIDLRKIERRVGPRRTTFRRHPRA